MSFFALAQVQISIINQKIKNKPILKKNIRALHNSSFRLILLWQYNSNDQITYSMSTLRTLLKHFIFE